MKNATITAQVGTALLLVSILQATARDISYWPYEKLRNEADLIVIGVAEQSEDTGELVPSPLLQLDFVGVNTTINIHGVLSGRSQGASITVFHLRVPDGKFIPDDSKIVRFKTQAPALRGTAISLSPTRPEYLLYLKKRKDGRYEPVSGPLDAVYSIREVHWMNKE